MKQIVALFALLIGVMLVAAWLSQPGSLEKFGLAPLTQAPPETKTKTMTVGEAEFAVEIAQTEKERSRGLAGRESLAAREGMLFVFPENSQPSFWMKGVNFSLDIIWISDGKVVQITESVPPTPDTPDNQLKLYPANQPVDFVLEIAGGEVESLVIKVGDQVTPPEL